MKAILFVLAKGVAFLAGAGVLNTFWLIATFGIDYIASIFSHSEEVPGEDYRNLDTQEFLKTEQNIKMTTAKKLVASAIAYGIGYIANLASLFG
jgi:hypothetical protein